MEKRILRLKDNTGISSTMNDTIDDKTIALESAFMVEVQNEDHFLRNDEHNMTNVVKYARVFYGYEKEQTVVTERNDHEAYWLFNKVEVIHTEVMK